MIGAFSLLRRGLRCNRNCSVIRWRSVLSISHYSKSLNAKCRYQWFVLAFSRGLSIPLITAFRGQIKTPKHPRGLRVYHMRAHWRRSLHNPNIRDRVPVAVQYLTTFDHLSEFAVRLFPHAAILLCCFWMRTILTWIDAHPGFGGIYFCYDSLHPCATTTHRGTPFVFFHFISSNMGSPSKLEFTFFPLVN